MPSCKISWCKNVHEKGKVCSNLIYNIVSLGKVAGKKNLLAIEKSFCYFEWF